MAFHTGSPSLLLASSSAYRRSLMERLRLPFQSYAPDIDESALPGEKPADTALRLALAKARAIAVRHPQALIVGSDQVAELDGHALGKPGTHENAASQLRQMRGRSVVFHTALCLLDASSDRYQVDNVPSVVQFRQFTDSQIETYLRAEQPYDCAGSAKIEGLGIALVERIESCDPSALIGLPLMALTTMLQREGIDIL